MNTPMFTTSFFTSTMLINMVYVIISVIAMIWVSRILYKHGRVFLIDAFPGNEKFAISVNRILLVGFYLINMGFIMMLLRLGGRYGHELYAVQSAAGRIGGVLIVLGIVLYYNMCYFNKLRRKGSTSVPSAAEGKNESGNTAPSL